MPDSRSYRILMITYHFPPSTVAAAFRPLRHAKYLPELGHELWVLTASPSAYESGRVDEELVKEAPESVRVIRVPNPNPIHAYERRRPGKTNVRSKGRRLAPAGSAGAGGKRRLRTFFAELAKFPDSDGAWVALSLFPALYTVLVNRIDLIYSSGPPFGAHVLGLLLKKITGRKWIAQYGNPWTANPSITWDFPVFGRIANRLDLSIVRSADAVAVIDSILAECMRELGRSEHLYVCPNGYDPAHFSPTPLPGGKFTITYAGSLYNMHDPSVIYEALNILERKRPGVRADLKLIFAGTSASHEMARNAPRDIEFTGPLPHAKMIERLNASHVLLDFLTAASGVKFSTSCKIYEYMAARRPILAVAPEGPLADAVSGLNLGKVIPADDPVAVAEAIADFHSAYVRGELEMPDNPAITAYSAPEQARALIDIADSICPMGNEKLEARRAK